MFKVSFIPACCIKESMVIGRLWRGEARVLLSSEGRPAILLATEVFGDGGGILADIEISFYNK